MAGLVKIPGLSMDEVIKDVTERGPESRGVIAIFLSKDGGGHYRISGFTSNNDLFTLCGLLDWVKADLIAETCEESE